MGRSVKQKTLCINEYNAILTYDTMFTSVGGVREGAVERGPVHPQEKSADHREHIRSVDRFFVFIVALLCLN